MHSFYFMDQEFVYQISERYNLHDISKATIRAFKVFSFSSTIVELITKKYTEIIIAKYTAK